ncbi:MAG: hypothetical protein J0L75_17515 [Spirochaetes bacterium]|nr:hypothetical protein [Spirochaetota bacterium]
MTSAPGGKPGWSELLRFFLPLAFQSAAQSFSYPLVAMIASRGEGGTLNLAGLAQSNSVLFLLGTLGAGLVTTGMIWAKTTGGYRAYVRLNFATAVVVTVLHALCCLPPVAHLLFGSLIGLPPGIEAPARLALTAAIPLQFLFFLRNPSQVLLYINKATGLASLATLLRIAGTLLLTPVFCAFGLVGPVWAVVALGLPLIIETGLSRAFAAPYLRRIKPGKGKVPRIRELFAFNLPLTLGGFFLSFTGMVIGAVVSRAADPETMLPAYYMAAGLAGPAAFAASRIQAVVISFPAIKGHPYTVPRFALTIGVAFGFLPLVFVLPFAAHWYYVGFQNCPPHALPLVRESALALFFHPAAIALRAYQEGRAARLKNSMAILTGQGCLLAVLAIGSFLCLTLHLPGNLIPPVSFLAANLAAGAAVAALLGRERKPRPAVPVQSDAAEGYE